MNCAPEADLYFPSSEVNKLRQIVQHNFHRVCGELPTPCISQSGSQLRSSTTTFHIDTGGNLLLPTINTPTLEAEIDHINRLMLPKDSGIQADEATRRLRHHLLVEYCLLQDWIVQGVSVMPELDPQSMDWEGIASPEAGIYRGLHIPFFVKFSVAYPVEPPIIVFDPVLMHPLIDAATGELSLAAGFGKWKAEAHNLVQVLAYIRSIFFDAKLLKSAHAINATAGERIADMGLVAAGVFFRDNYKRREPSRRCRFSLAQLDLQGSSLDVQKIIDMAQAASEAIGSRRLKHEKPASIDSHIDLRISADLLEASAALWDAFSISLEDKQKASLRTTDAT